jgi:hypothetical protein
VAYEAALELLGLSGLQKVTARLIEAVDLKEVRGTLVGGVWWEGMEGWGGAWGRQVGPRGIERVWEEAWKEVWGKGAGGGRQEGRTEEWVHGPGWRGGGKGWRWTGRMLFIGKHIVLEGRGAG